MCFFSLFFLVLTTQRDNDKDHKVRLAIGNGVRAEIWREFLHRFGNIEVREFYASTEGNVGFLNYVGKIGAVGRVNFIHRVRVSFSCFFFLYNETCHSKTSYTNISSALHHGTWHGAIKLHHHTNFCLSLRCDNAILMSLHMLFPPVEAVSLHSH